jgi:cytochrome c550
MKKNNPVIPYILIMAFGIALIFFMSLEGAGKDEAEGGETAGNGDAQLVQSCLSCHGGNLEGGMGPALVGLDSAHIVDVLVNGLPGSNFMTPGMKSEAEAQAIADYISSLE